MTNEGQTQLCVYLLFWRGEQTACYGSVRLLNSSQAESHLQTKPILTADLRRITEPSNPQVLSDTGNASRRLRHISTLYPSKESMCATLQN